MMLVPFHPDIDFYGKDASKATSGTDMLFRLYGDEKGVYKVVCLSKEEADKYRKDNASGIHRGRAA